MYIINAKHCISSSCSKYSLRLMICAYGGVISTILATYGFSQRTVSEWDCIGGKGFCIQITPTIWMRQGMFEIIGLFPFVKD